MYHVTTDGRFPYTIYGAQQDSGAIAVASRTDHGNISAQDWVNVGGGESGYLAIDPNDPDIIYATGSYGGVSRYNRRTATKHAVVGLVRSLAAQLAAKRITINAICPSVVDTPLVGPARERLKEAGFPMIAPEDIADAVVLCMTGGVESGECVVCQADRAPEPHVFSAPPSRR
jgi:NAD(P)-dependent dehydrogenase (short-subunit alcohol dehydrogenase family)